MYSRVAPTSAMHSERPSHTPSASVTSWVPVGKSSTRWAERARGVDAQVLVRELGRDRVPVAAARLPRVVLEAATAVDLQATLAMPAGNRRATRGQLPGTAVRQVL